MRHDVSPDGMKRRFDRAPLIEAVRARAWGDGVTVTEFCRARAIPLREIDPKRGRIGWVLADRIACRAGLNPYLVWPDYGAAAA